MIFSPFLVILSLSIAVPLTNGQDDNGFLYDVFPSNFKWGFATASYQVKEKFIQLFSLKQFQPFSFHIYFKVEGAWNEDGNLIIETNSILINSHVRNRQRAEYLGRIFSS